MSRPAIGFKKVRAELEPGVPAWKMRYAQWDGKPMRCPKKGELYLSGAVVQAYRATNDLATQYFIAVPVQS